MVDNSVGGTRCRSSQNLGEATRMSGNPPIGVDGGENVAKLINRGGRSAFDVNLQGLRKVIDRRMAGADANLNYSLSMIKTGAGNFVAHLHQTVSRCIAPRALDGGSEGKTANQMLPLPEGDDDWHAAGIEPLKGTAHLGYSEIPDLI